MKANASLTRFLANAHPLVFNLFCITTAFASYFSIYAYRRPFTVGTYAGMLSIPGLPAIDYKVMLLIAQLFGYTLSKFAGIKLVSEAKSKNRFSILLGSILFSELALLFFAICPIQYGWIFLFLNGIPLGMVWGILFSYLEGRKTTEVLSVSLSTSYILSSGMVKSVGSWLLHKGLPEMWMPFSVGLLFFPIFFISSLLLHHIPPPTKEEETLRTKRTTMSGEQRKKFFFQYAPGLICLTFFYMILTAYRDFRDNFSREIWDSVGFTDDSLVFTSSEVPTAILVLFILSAIMWVKDNRKAVTIIHSLLIFGAVLIGGATFLFEKHMISPFMWMTLIGFGVYLGYVPFGSILYDRIIAETRFVGTASFMIYLSDSFGYLGSVFVLLYKNFASHHLSWFSFFIQFSYLTSLSCTCGFIMALWYFRKKGAPNPREPLPSTPQR
jgi:hypothetical protein